MNSVIERTRLVIGLLLTLAAPGMAAAGSPIDPDEGRPRVRSEHAMKVLDRLAFVHGEVKQIEDKGSVTLLRFPGEFSAVIFRNNRDRFPADLTEAYSGKLVQVRGIVTSYAGAPQIALGSPSQISILKETPTEFLPAARPYKGGGELKMATFNILNLFDDLDDPYRNDDSTKPKGRDQLEHVAEVLRQLDADVVALQEVESRGYLERFVEVFLAELGYEEVVHFEGNDQRGIDVCLLSRIPVGTVRSHRHLRFPGPDGKPMRFERDLLQVELLPDGAEPIEVWVVHLKSNYDGRAHAEPIRLSEAKAVRRLLDQRLEQDPKARIILCGDFNDTEDSDALKTLIGSGPRAMKSFADEVPKEQRITYNEEPYRTMIDFILASPALADRYVPGSFSIRHGEVDTTGSDHNAVSARFQTKN